MATIVIKDSKDDKDRNGGLGKALLLANELTLIYRVKERSRYCNCNLNVVNPKTTDAEVKIWITREKLPGDVDLIESKILLSPDAVYVRTNLVIGPNEAVFAQSNIEGTVIRVEGFENNLL